MSNEITELEMRDCYYIYRAMHDGVCPQCGNHGQPIKFECGELGLQCPECNFTITKPEIEAITSKSEKILKRRLESFNRVRRVLVQ